MISTYVRPRMRDIAGIVLLSVVGLLNVAVLSAAAALTLAVFATGFEVGAGLSRTLNCSSEERVFVSGIMSTASLICGGVLLTATHIGISHASIVLWSALVALIGALWRSVLSGEGPATVGPQVTGVGVAACVIAGCIIVGAGILSVRSERAQAKAVHFSSLSVQRDRAGDAAIITVQNHE